MGVRLTPESVFDLARCTQAVAHGEVIKAAADLVKSLAVSLSTWGMRSNSTSAGRAAGTRRRRILGTAGCACSWSKPFPFPTPLE